MKKKTAYSIGIYVRESRDDKGENYETIENQRDMLIAHAQRYELGHLYAVYTDDNVSGSDFERTGLSRLKNDVVDGRINLLLLKDLSRLGRNNAKTLQFLDFLEEYGVRIISSDGRYDSLYDNEMVGIETWVNERYVRDISRKIRSCLRFKIQKGEYIGNAPYGYRKTEEEKNRLCPHETEAGTVKYIYRLYLGGYGYSKIAAILNNESCPAPRSDRWNRTTVRRILCSRVYVGDTVQGVSERISFKSKKTRRLPQEEWVITEGTHEAIVSDKEFREVQKLRAEKQSGKAATGRSARRLSGIIWCGSCGNVMYARKREAGITYICGNYFRNGRAACKSHFVSENQIMGFICDEMGRIFLKAEGGYENEITGMTESLGFAEDRYGSRTKWAQKQTEAYRRQQEILYMDRLKGRISEELFLKMRDLLEGRLKTIENKFGRKAVSKAGQCQEIANLVSAMIDEVKNSSWDFMTNNMVRLFVKRIVIYDKEDSPPDLFSCKTTATFHTGGDTKAGGEEFGQGAILIDFFGPEKV